MNWSFWVIIVLSLILGGWMLFDGINAVATGNFITPSEGVEYAGQLGPWAYFIEGIGIDPCSTFMKVLFVIYGLTWLLLIAYFWLELPWAWMSILIMSIITLWYLPFGTIIGIINIILLFSQLTSKSTLQA